MRILWSNIFAFALLIFAFWLASSSCADIKMSLATIDAIGAGDLEREVRGLIVLSVCLVSFIAILKVVISQNNQRKK